MGPEFEKGDGRLRPRQRGPRRDAQPPHATPLAAVLFPAAPVLSWSTWSAVINLTSRAGELRSSYFPFSACVSASASQSRAQCCARELCGKILSRSHNSGGKPFRLLAVSLSTAADPAREGSALGKAMFKNTFQSGFLSILYSIGSKPLQIWEREVRNGHIKRITDNDIQSSVLEIMSTNISTTFITCPDDASKTLGIKLPFLVMIIKNVRASSSLPPLGLRAQCLWTGERGWRPQPPPLAGRFVPRASLALG